MTRIVLPKPGIEIWRPFLRTASKKPGGLRSFLRDAEIGRHATLRGSVSARHPEHDVHRGDAAYPDDHRWAVDDNMWTRAPIDDLLPGIRRIAETMPKKSQRTFCG